MMTDSSRKKESLEKIVKSKFTAYEAGTISGVACGAGIKKAELETIFIESKDIVDALIRIISILNNRTRF